MPVLYTKPNDATVHDAGEPEHDVQGPLLVLIGEASAKARKKLRLARDATVLDALAAASGVEKERLAPLALWSDGIYTEDDYLAQFEEDWEREEYGRHAAEVVARNNAAWQPPAALLSAIDVAREHLRDAKLAKAVLPDDWWMDTPDALTALRDLVQRAADDGATRVCVELEE